MELVYQLGNGSKWQDNELRYSLRSVAMHGTNVDRITIVGNCPAWVQGVNHVPLPDPYRLKADNSWYKMRRFCDGRTEPFVLMNDDFFLLQPTDFNNLPSYSNGTIEQLALSYKRKGDYITVLLATERVLLNNNLPVKNYALHVPMLIQPQKIRRMFERFNERPGVSFRLLCGNLARRDDDIEMNDVKLCDWYSQEYTTEFIQDKPCFSIGDRFLTMEGKAFLEQLYPEKSKYEK